MAQADRVNTTSRRRFLAAAAAAGAILAPNVAMSVPAGDDAKLVGLAARLTADRKKMDVLEAEQRLAHERFLELCPEKPEALLWRWNDIVGSERGTTFVRDGKHLSWCNAGEIRKLRGKTMVSYEFIGTDADHDTMPVRGYDDLGADPKYAHFFEAVPNAKRQARADQLIAALDEYEAAERAAEVMSGLDARDEQFEALEGQMLDAFRQMTRLVPTTLDGYRAMATAVVAYCWSGKIERGQYGDERAIASMFSNLTGVPIAAAA